MKNVVIRISSFLLLILFCVFVHSCNSKAKESKKNESEVSNSGYVYRYHGNIYNLIDSFLVTYKNNDNVLNQGDSTYIYKYCILGCYCLNNNPKFSICVTDSIEKLKYKLECDTILKIFENAHSKKQIEMTSFTLVKNIGGIIKFNTINKRYSDIKSDDPAAFGLCDFSFQKGMITLLWGDGSTDQYLLSLQLENNKFFVKHYSVKQPIYDVGYTVYNLDTTIMLSNKCVVDIDNLTEQAFRSKPHKELIDSIGYQDLYPH